MSRRLQEHQVIGRRLPTDANPTPKLYRMRVFAPNDVVAKSRFWYFLTKMRKVMTRMERLSVSTWYAAPQDLTCEAFH